MGDRSSIEWTDATWNPIVGCTRCSPGCDHCYAIGVVHRQMSAQHRGLTVVADDGVDWNGQINVVEHLLDQPLRWKKPRRIFVNSLSDLFHPAVPSHVIRSIWRVMVEAEQHTFQVLTKRPKRMAAWVAANNEVTVPTPPNIWLGVSIESNDYAWRAEDLRATPAAVRWISAEPLLGPLDQVDLTGIDWVVAGGESGPGARPMHPQWVRDLRDLCALPEDPIACPECVCDASLTFPSAAPGAPDRWEYECLDGHVTKRPGPAFLFKQWGSWAPWIAEDWSEDAGGSTFVKLDGTTSWAGGSDDYCTNWSANYEEGDHAITKMAKASARRVLDGRTWDEFPAVAR